MTTKFCFSCKEHLPISDFGRDKRRPAGISCWCKRCSNKKIAVIRATPEGREAHRQCEFRRHRENPERNRQKAREWHAANRERAQEVAKRLGRNRRHCAIWREWEKVRQGDWYRRNSAHGIAKVRRRQMAQSQAMPRWLSSIQKAQIQEFYEIAVARSVQTGIKYTVDHIHPLRGDGFCGLHVPWNLQVVPGSWNFSKGNKLVEWKAA